MSQWRSIIFSKRTLSLVVIVAMVRVYGAFIEGDLPGGMPLTPVDAASAPPGGTP